MRDYPISKQQIQFLYKLLAKKTLSKDKVFLIKQYINDAIFIKVALDLSELSHCVSRQVGCIITKENKILTTGINGTAPDQPNCDELFDHSNFDPKLHREWSDINETHAELNAINFAAKFGISIDNSTLYCSLQPCLQCSKNIPFSGIQRVVFDQFYDRVDSFEQQKQSLNKKGIEIVKLLPFDEFFLSLNLAQY